MFDRVEKYKQLLLFPQCFQTASFPDPSKDVIVWEWVKPSTRQGPLLIPLRKMPFKNIVGKGENDST